jgi:hypothetical protein
MFRKKFLLSAGITLPFQIYDMRLTIDNVINGCYRGPRNREEIAFSPRHNDNNKEEKNMRNSLIGILGLLGAFAMIVPGCDSGTEDAVIATGTCTLGESQCEGNTAMVCLADGTWESTVCEEGFMCMGPHDDEVDHHCMPEMTEGGEATEEEGGEATEEVGGEATEEEGGEATEEEGGEATEEEGGEATEEEGGEATEEEGGEATEEEGGEATQEEGGEATQEEGGEATEEEGGEATEEEGGEATEEEGGEATEEEGGEATEEEGGEATEEEGGEATEEEGGEAVEEEGGEAVEEGGGEAVEEEGACTNDADFAIVTTIDVQGVLSANAIECFDLLSFSLDPECLLEKLTDETALSDTCAQCFVDTAICGAEFCQAECIDGGEDCLECSAEAGCTAELELCSGVSQP